MGTDRLERLHERPLPDPSMRVAEHGLQLQDKIRTALTPETEGRFASFVHAVLPPLVGPIRRHQARPVFRVHLHGGHSISGFHRDRSKGQPSSVWNLWLPFTDVWDTNGIAVESEEGADDATPITLRYGQAIVFQAADLLHGSVGNRTGSTRVSCDIRFKRG